MKLKKISKEALWNQLILNKYKNKVKIDEKKKKKLKTTKNFQILICFMK